GFLPFALPPPLVPVLLLLLLPQPAATNRASAKTAARPATAPLLLRFRCCMCPPPPCSPLSLLRPAPQLVEVDGDDEDGPDGDLLPEGLDADDDEAVAEHCRDEDAEDGAEDRPDPAEQRGTSDDHAGDRVQVVGRMPPDRRRREARERHEARKAAERAGEHVHLDEMAVDLQPRPPRRLLAGPD